MTSKRILAAALLFAAFACPGPAAAQTTLRIGLAEDPDILDPTLARTFVGRIVFASLCDKLVDISPELDIVPRLAQLSDRAGMIVSPKAAQAAGDKFGEHPVCAGPFKFAERVAQDRIVLDRFTDYWNKDAIHFDR